MRFGAFQERVVEDLSDTLYVQPGGIGIAAPQIGYSVRVVLVDASKKDPTKKKIILINPEIVSVEGEKVGREGCMSIPDFTANIKRAIRIWVLAKNAQFEDYEFTSDGIEAICIQHEVDHLNGLLFFDRVNSLTRDVFRRKKYSH